MPPFLPRARQFSFDMKINNIHAHNMIYNINTYNLYVLYSDFLSTRTYVNLTVKPFNSNFCGKLLSTWKY